MLLIVSELDRGLRLVLVGVGMFRGGRAESLSEEVDFDDVVALDPIEVLSILGRIELPLHSPLSEDGEIRTKGSETIVLNEIHTSNSDRFEW
jgi:hypothetical protein